MAIQTNITFRLAVTISIGAIGGWIMSLAHIPLAWMLGAMIATSIVALSGGNLLIPMKLRAVMLAVLGVMLGSSFTPAVVERLGDWVNTLSAMTIFAFCVPAIGYFGLKKFFLFDRPTAFFSAVPGGLTNMVITGGAMGGDDRTIALIHSIRIMLTVLIIPLWFRIMEGTTSINASDISATLIDLGVKDVFILSFVGVAGFFTAKILRIPAYPLVGPMIASAAIHLAGMTSAKPPIELVNLAQIVVGSSIGCRFIGTSIRKVPRTLICGILTGLFMLGAAALAAFLLAPYTDASFTALWLAFAPGGLPEMALMSIALGVDPAFVSSHHLYRVLLLVILAPIFYTFLEHWVKRKSSVVNSDDLTD
ncbi:MAG: AbrB family transcriptional regulator [Rhodospirillales bacterium]|nr:AbrB family transcriptional regulator [Rhodospirillales bacterium]